MIGSKKIKMLREIQSTMDQYRIKDIRYSCTIGFDSNISASIYYRTKDEDTIYWFLYDLENISLSDLNIIKDRIKADLQRISKSTDIKKIKKELPLEKSGDVDITAFLKRFKEDNQNDNEKAKKGHKRSGKGY